MQKNPELTQQKIISAFMDLYEQKTIDKISIGELTAKAELYRGTFYYYYEDIYDLLHRIEKKFIELIGEIVAHMIDGIFSQSIEAEVPYLLSCYQKNEQQIQLFLIKRPNSAIIRQMKDAAKQIALSILNIKNDSLSARALYIVEYIASAQLGLVTRWLQNGQDISADELVNIMQSVNLNGAITCLLNEV